MGLMLAAPAGRLRQALVLFAGIVGGAAQPRDGDGRREGGGAVRWWLLPVYRGESSGPLIRRKTVVVCLGVWRAAVCWPLPPVVLHGCSSGLQDTFVNIHSGTHSASSMLLPTQTHTPVSHSLNESELRPCTSLIKIFCLLPT